MKQSQIVHFVESGKKLYEAIAIATARVEGLAMARIRVDDDDQTVLEHGPEFASAPAAMSSSVERAGS